MEPTKTSLGALDTQTEVDSEGRRVSECKNGASDLRKRQLGMPKNDFKHYYCEV